MLLRENMNFFEGSHALADALDAVDGDKPWMNLNIDKTQLYQKTENILSLEQEIQNTQDRIDGCKDDEEIKRREFQVHRQHWEEIKNYLERRKLELVEPTIHVQSLVMNALPDADAFAKICQRKRSKKLQRVEHLFRTAHCYQDARNLLFTLRGNAELQRMVHFMERSILDLRERIRVKEELFRNIDNLVEFKIRLQAKLKQKCRDVAWTKVRQWGIANDVLLRKCFSGWDDVVPLLAVYDRTSCYDDLWAEFKEKLKEIDELEAQKKEIEGERDEAYGKFQEAEQRVKDRLAEHEVTVGEEYKRHNDYLSKVDGENKEKLDKLNAEKGAEKEHIRSQLQNKQDELERLLKELEKQNEGQQNLIRRVVPQNKGIRCMGCTKQMLFRECIVINGEHDFPDFDNLKARTLDAVREGSPRPRISEHILGQDSPLARRVEMMGHSVTSSTGVFRDPRLQSIGQHSGRKRPASSGGLQYDGEDRIGGTLVSASASGSGTSTLSLAGGGTGASFFHQRPRTTGSDAAGGTRAVGDEFIEGGEDEGGAERMQIKLRKVENFLEAQRRREKDEAGQAKRQLRSRKRDVIPGGEGEETFEERMRRDVREFREKFCIKKWK
eukprot:g8760.t1